MKQKKSIKAAAIIVAGGKSSRFGGKLPKQFFPLQRLPVFLWSVLTFKKISEFKQIILVVPERYINLALKQSNKFGYSVVTGGKERFDSVRNGLKKLNSGINYVAIHDAARPMISPEIIKNCLDESVKTKAAIVAIPATDTVKISNNNSFIKNTFPRTKVWLAQTPQIFERKLIESAYKNLGNRLITDDAQAVELLGKKVKLVEGNSTNIKITHNMDLKLANIFLTNKNR